MIHDGWMTTVLLKPNVILFHFFKQLFVWFDTIMFAIDSNGGSMLVFEEKNGPMMLPNQKHQTFTHCACLGYY